MASVEVIFQGAKFSFNSDQPERLKELAARLEEKVSVNSRAGKCSKSLFDPKVLLMAALVMEDEIEHLRKQVSELELSSQSVMDDATEMVAGAIDKVAACIEEFLDGVEEQQQV